MTIIEKATIKHYHQHRIKRGQYSRAGKQGWISDEAQKVRHEVIMSLADFNNASVLDVGCGYGDLKDLLEERFRRFDYIGIDQQPEFIEEARKKYEGQPGVWFYEADVAACQLPQMDIVVASGLLSYRSESYQYYFGMIKRLFEAAEKSFIFNMLDDTAFQSTELLVAHSKEKVVAFCQELAVAPVLIDNYLKNDFTICMNK